MVILSFFGQEWHDYPCKRNKSSGPANMSPAKIIQRNFHKILSSKTTVFRLLQSDSSNPTPPPELLHHLAYRSADMMGSF